MQILVRDCPREPGPARDEWLRLDAELRALAWRAHRARNWKPRGSRKSRKLFHERVVLPAIARDNGLRSALLRARDAVAVDVPITLGDWKHETIYSTVEIPTGGA